MTFKVTKDKEVHYVDIPHNLLPETARKVAFIYIYRRSAVDYTELANNTVEVKIKTVPMDVVEYLKDA